MNPDAHRISDGPTGPKPELESPSGIALALMLERRNALRAET